MKTMAIPGDNAGSMSTKADSMGRARLTVFVLVLLIALFLQLASSRAAIAAPGKPQNTGPSNKPIYFVGCQGGSLGSPAVSATPQSALSLPPEETAATTTPSPVATATETDPLWAECEDCNPIHHPILDLMLATALMFIAAVVVKHVLSSLSNWSHWKKLEGAAREYIADKDLDKLEGCCRHYNRAAAAAVIAAMAAQVKIGNSKSLVNLERLKQAARSATRTELSKWKSPINCLDGSAWVSLTVLATWAVSELARSLNELSQGGGPGVLLFGFREDFALLWCGLLLLVFHLVLRRMILSRISRLEFRINQLSIDFIIGLMSRPNRRLSRKYQPGIWMTIGRRSSQPPSTSTCKTEGVSGRTLKPVGHWPGD